MISRPAITMLLSATLFGVESAAAEISAVSFLREVTTFATANLASGETLFDVDETRFEESGPFDEIVTSAVAEGGTHAMSSADQTSSLEPHAVVVSGAFSGDAVVDGGATFAEALGGSRLIYRFELSSPVTYQISGSLEAAGNGGTHVVLDAISRELVVAIHVTEGQVPVEESGLLTEGLHELTVHSSGYSQAFPEGSNPSSGGFAITMLLGSSTDASPLAAAAELRIFPNPIRTHATISLPNVHEGDVAVFDVTGRMVRELGPASASRLTWDTRDDRGRAVASGVYFVRVGAHLTRTSVVR